MSGRDVASEMADMAANLEEKTGRNMSWWIEDRPLIGQDQTQ